MDHDSNSVNPVVLRRSTRRRSSITPQYSVTEQTKTETIENAQTAIEKIYLPPKSVKDLKVTPLETIYEEPQATGDKVQFMSVRKYKRSFTFAELINLKQKQKQKNKARIAKARKVTSHARKKVKITMEVLKKKLAELDQCESN